VPGGLAKNHLHANRNNLACAVHERLEQARADLSLGNNYDFEAYSAEIR
jgi:hypothetical protein